MEFEITAIVKVRLENIGGKPTSKHINTQSMLHLSPNLDPDIYLNRVSNHPTREGCRVMAHALIQGLVANIHVAHQDGHWDSAEQLRFIIAELEKGFVAPMEVQKGVYFTTLKEEEGGSNV